MASATTKTELPPLNIVVILGSVRQGRNAPRVGKFIVSKLNEKKHKVTLLDPAELKLPMLEKAYHHYRPGETPPENLQKIAAVLEAADAIIPISAEYNHAVPPALANTLDHFGGKQYMFKPSAIVTYSAGQYGGARAGVALRSLLGELGCLSVSAMLSIGLVSTKLDEDGKTTDAQTISAADRMITQLEWNAHAMRIHRATFGVPH